MKRNLKDQINFGLKIATTMLVAGVVTVTTLICIDLRQTDPVLSIAGLIGESALVLIAVVRWIENP